MRFSLALKFVLYGTVQHNSSNLRSKIDEKIKFIFSTSVSQ
jgi:hypothetical protein